jgi:TPR repeat protein
MNERSGNLAGAGVQRESPKPDGAKAQSDETSGVGRQLGAGPLSPQPPPPPVAREVLLEETPTKRQDQSGLLEKLRALGSVLSTHVGFTPTSFLHEEIAKNPTDVGYPLPSSIGTAPLRQAAVQGDAAAEFEVAGRFADGNGVTRDLERAVFWYQRAAMHGFPPAQYRLAVLYERGTGMTADRERAKIWYRRAAEQGHLKAMHGLAALLASGNDGVRDYAAAITWFKEAARRGLADSQFDLGMLYSKGQGVVVDLPEAYKWFALAMQSGDREAARHFEEVRARLGPQDLSEAERRLAAWHQAAAAPNTRETAPRLVGE